MTLPEQIRAKMDELSKRQDAAPATQYFVSGERNGLGIAACMAEEQERRLRALCADLRLRDKLEGTARFAMAADRIEAVLNGSGGGEPTTTTETVA